MGGLTPFICSYLNKCVWMFSRLHAPTVICPCGIYQKGTSASLSPDGRLRIYFGKSANPMVLHLSGMCVSHRDTPVPIEDTTSLQPSPSRWQVASLREDGRAHTIHLFVFKQMCLDVLALARTNGHLFMWNLPQGHERFSVARWQVADLRRQERESDGPSLVWYVCQSPRRPCPSRTRHHCSHRRSDREDRFTKLMCTCTGQYSCVFVLFGWVPKHVREHALANPRWVKDAPGTTRHHLFCNGVHLQFQCFGKLAGGRSIIELSGRQVPTAMLRSHG